MRGVLSIWGEIYRVHGNLYLPILGSTRLGSVHVLQQLLFIKCKRKTHKHAIKKYRWFGVLPAAAFLPCDWHAPLLDGMVCEYTSWVCTRIAPKNVLFFRTLINSNLNQPQLGFWIAYTVESDQNGRTLLARLLDGPLSPARRTRG